MTESLTSGAQSEPSNDALVDWSKGKIDIGKAIKLRFSKGLTLDEIGKVFGCSRQAVSQALQPYETLFKDKDALSVYRDNQEQIMEGVLNELTLKILDSDKLKKASTNNIAYAFDIFFKNLRLLRDQSTSNIAHAQAMDADLAEIERKIAELEGRIIADQDDEQVIDAEIAALESDLSDNEEG